MPGIPPNPLFFTLAFLGFFLASFPLPLHIQLRNTGTSMFMLWTSLGYLMLSINSIIWNDNVTNLTPVWCDISSRYIVGASVGIPASSLCIVRRLYYIINARTISVQKKQIRREIMVDALISIGFPCVVMALQYVVQNARFSIFEQIGCYPSICNTLAAYFLVFMWPLVIGLISLVYAALTFRRTSQQKQQLQKMLKAGFFISSGHYWRLMALCCSEIIFAVPLSLYSIIMNALSTRPAPYHSWAWIHSDFSRVGQYPTFVWKSTPDIAASLETTRWLYILCSLIVFAFFGWTQEARNFYRQAFWSVCGRLGYSQHTAGSRGKRRIGNLSPSPDDVDQQTTSEHYSLPFQARGRVDSSSSAPPSPEPVFSDSRLSVNKGLTEDFLPLSDHVGHIQTSGIPAAPEPALVHDRCSLTLNQDLGQLV